MKIVDVNILIHAHNPNSDSHEPIKDWWERTLNIGERIGLGWITIVGFLRLSTNPRVMPRPMDWWFAIAAVESFIKLENVRIVCETEDHWRILQKLIEEAGTAGNLVTDAHVAALAIGHGATLVSCDNDFSRFKGLRWENPLA